MTEARHAPALGITTRDLILAFILAKLIAAAMIVALAGIPPEGKQLVTTLAGIVSMVVFVLLLMLGGRQSIREVVSATSAVHMPAGNALRWAAVAVLAGLAIRFGISGMILGALHVLDPTSIAAETDDLAAALKDPTRPLDALAIVLVLIAATIEEIVYRRILQTCICRRFGLTAGVIGVALLVGAVHVSVPAALMGAWLGLLYLYSGRLWVAALAHAVANLAVFAMAAMQQPAMQQLFFVACYTCAALMVVATVWGARAVRGQPAPLDPQRHGGG
jgi:membrane protease YdiL (CAAX protease family)